MEVLFALYTKGGTMIHSTYRTYPEGTPQSKIEADLDTWAEDAKSEMFSEWGEQ